MPFASKNRISSQGNLMRRRVSTNPLSSEPATGKSFYQPRRFYSCYLCLLEMNVKITEEEEDKIRENVRDSSD